MNPRIPTVTIPVKGGTATIPNARDVIVLVELTVDGVETVTRLDVQKIMFIDEVPASWSHDDAQAIASTLSASVRNSERSGRG